MSTPINQNRAHFLQQQKLQQLHKNEAAAHTREAAQRESQAEHAQAQGRYGDTMFRTVPMPPGPPPRQLRQPGQRGDVRPARSDGKDTNGPEEPVQAERTERREGGEHKGPVEATDGDAEGKHQHHHGEPHADGDRSGNFGGGQSGGGSSGGGQSSGGHSGGQSGGGGSHSGGQGQGQSRQAATTRFSMPAAGRSVSTSPLGAASAAPEIQAFRSALSSVAAPERRARFLAEAMVSLSKRSSGRFDTDATMMSLMAAYIEASQEPGALSTLARVKQVLVEMGPAISGALPPGPRERNRFALLPLKLLVSDRMRTEQQRAIAAERLRAGQRWPADTIEMTP
jgi:hypothetical protein